MQALLVLELTGLGLVQKAFGATYLPSNPNDPAQLALAGTSTNANFGTLDVRSVGISPRYLQFALRVTF